MSESIVTFFSSAIEKQGLIAAVLTFLLIWIKKLVDRLFKIIEHSSKVIEKNNDILHDVKNLIAENNRLIKENTKVMIEVQTYLKMLNNRGNDNDR